MFDLSKEELQNLENWSGKHYFECPYTKPENQGCIGGALTFMFTPTTLGQVFKVKCACGEVKDCSNYDSW